MENETVELAFDVHDNEQTNPELSPVIMMHGATFSKSSMDHLARGLSRETRRQVYSIDLRNHGRSPETRNLCYPMLIADAKRFITERGLRKFSFVCHSFSSTVAYVISLDMPHAVEKMVFIDNPPFNENSQSFNEANAYPNFRLHLRLLKSLNPKLSLKDARARFLRLSKESQRGQKKFYRKVAYELIKEEGKFQFRHDYAYGFEQYKKGCLTLEPRGSSDKEILILRCPDSSQVWDAKFEAVKKHNPRAQLLTFENTSHLLMFEEPEKFIQVTAMFLREPS